MSDFETFLKPLGLLHDAVVSQLVWVPEQKRLRLEIDDLYGNFRKLPQYPGPVSGVIEFGEVHRIAFDMDHNETRLIIFTLDTEHVDGDLYLASIEFWPDGEIRVWYRRVTFPPIEELGARS
jgi:hypothetical protein